LAAALRTAIYAGAACCVVHSHVEAVGLTALEALSMGIPVAASEIAGHREACGDSAVYYPVDDLGALADAVRLARARPRQPDARDGFLAATWEENASALAGIFRDVAAARRSARAR
jgi:glycosyltransferase involved in cell wall biosynthesis